MKRKNLHDQTPEILGGPTDQKTLNVMLGLGMLNQVDQTIKAGSEHGGVSEDHKDPVLLRIFKAIFGAILIIGCLSLILMFATVFFGTINNELFRKIAFICIEKNSEIIKTRS